MIGSCLSAVLEGVSSTMVNVEADVTNGLPQFSIVGLPDSAVSESKLRIRSAIRNAGFTFPNKRITVNLSPASVRKRGAGLDLAIAMAILRATGQVPQSFAENTGFCAELNLSGELVPIGGILNLAMTLRNHGVQQMVFAAKQLNQCILLPDFDWIAFDSLTEAVAALRMHSTLKPNVVTPQIVDSPSQNGDFSDVTEMDSVKRALLIAAVGRHHLVMMGPPGCGKTMLAERYSSILPNLDLLEVLEVLSIHQVVDPLAKATLLPPVRNPHHSVTVNGLIGGGTTLNPGEATLAHNGVLLLDELLEFSHQALEALREPLISKQVQLSRNGRTVILPANFQLIGTLNPCPCGQRGFGDCRCLMSNVTRYWSKLSGALADRIDMVVPVHPGSGTHSSPAKPVTSAQLRKQVMEARMQRAQLCTEGDRFKSHLTESALQILRRSEQALHLSARAIRSVRSIACSVAALEHSDVIHRSHIEEALGLHHSLTSSIR